MTLPKVPLIADFDLLRSADSNQFLLLPNTRHAKDWVEMSIEVPHWRGICLVFSESEILELATGIAKAGLIISSLALSYRLLLKVVQQAEGLDPSPIDLSFLPQQEIRLLGEGTRAACEPDEADHCRLSGLGVRWNSEEISEGL